MARVRTAYFFRGRKYVRYDVDRATGAESVNLGVYPRDVSAAWTAMPESFRTGIDAVVSWPDGFVYFFKGSKYVRWDATNDTVDTATYPRDISAGWRAFPASFAAGIDAAINWGDGRAFFFKGAKYIRYDIADDTVDPAIYPRDISDGWSDFPPAFAAGVDAAVNWGNGSAYFFKGGQYLNYDIAGDKVRPGYPLPVTEPGKWPALVAAGFAGPYDDVIEWPQADVESATIPANLVPCVKTSLPTVRCGGTFEMKALFTDANPSVPACGEYRQYVRGTFELNGAVVKFVLQEQGVAIPVVMRPRPGPGSTDDNFREDGMPASKSPHGVDMHYGHRDAAYGNRNLRDLYVPLRRSGAQYIGNDIPGFNGPAGTFFKIDADFRGQIVDVCNGGTVFELAGVDREMRGAVMAIVLDSPQQAGGYWVLPSIDAASGGEVRMHVAIAVGDISDLRDVDVQVVVVAGGRSLAVAQGPVAGVLPTIQLNGINAYAQYVFDNPGDPPPQTVQVTIRGGTASFDVSGGIV